MKNYYAILGVLPDAELSEIRSSFRHKVKRYHPDMSGGNPHFFARVHEAYEVLSTPEARRKYDQKYGRLWAFMGPNGTGAPGPTQRHTSSNGNPPQAPGSAEAPPNTNAQPRSAPKPASGFPLGVLTRIMSIAMPRTGRFQLGGLIGNIQIEPTLPEKLWETTLKKFGPADPAHLARHVIQIKLSGERDLVRSMMPQPKDFGVEFEQVREQEKKNRLKYFLDSIFGDGGLNLFKSGRHFGMYGAFIPLSLQITIPIGTTLHLKDITGTVTIGDTKGELMANMLGGVLKTGKVSKAHVVLNGKSRAFLAGAEGDVDLMGFGSSKSYLGGKIDRLRIVLENQAQAEVGAPLGNLQAEVNGWAALRVNQEVARGSCEARDRGRILLKSVTGPIKLSKTTKATIEAFSRVERNPAPGASTQGQGGNRFKNPAGNSSFGTRKPAFGA